MRRANDERFRRTASSISCVRAARLRFRTGQFRPFLAGLSRSESAVFVGLWFCDLFDGRDGRRSGVGFNGAGDNGIGSAAACETIRHRLLLVCVAAARLRTRGSQHLPGCSAIVGLYSSCCCCCRFLNLHCIRPVQTAQLAVYEYEYKCRTV